MTNQDMIWVLTNPYNENKISSYDLYLLTMNVYYKLGLEKPSLSSLLELDEKTIINLLPNGKRVIKSISNIDKFIYKKLELNLIGLQILTIQDKEYPIKFKEQIKKGINFSPYFFYVGNKTLLLNQCEGVVGSRDLDNEGVSYAYNIGMDIAKRGKTLVSGGARGSDSLAASGSYKLDGTNVIFLGTDVLDKVLKKQDEINSNRVVYLSTVPPEAYFEAKELLARNKYIYCLSSLTHIVSCQEHKGGTWSGAMEAINNHYCDLNIRLDNNAPAANFALNDLYMKTK